MTPQHQTYGFQGVNLQIVQSLTEESPLVSLSDNVLDRTPREIFDIVLDHLHDNRQALKVCSLVCKSWLSASRYHLFRSLVVRSRQSEKFGQVVTHRFSTLPNYVIHFTLGDSIDAVGSYFTPKLKLIRLIPRLSQMKSLRICSVNVEACREWRTLGSFTNVTDLEISFVRMSTCGNLLDLLAAIPSLEKVFLGEIFWNSIGELPSPRSFRHLRSLSVHCDKHTDILGWLSKESHPALSLLSVPARIVSGKFLQAAGGSLQELKLKMTTDPGYALDDGALFLYCDMFMAVYRVDPVASLGVINLACASNLRSITIDVIRLFYPDSNARFQPLIRMLSNITSPFLESISLFFKPLGPQCIYDLAGAIPWDELARIFLKHSNSLALINVVFPGVSVGPFSSWRGVVESDKRRTTELILAKVSDLNISEKLVISFLWVLIQAHFHISEFTSYR
jgi:hypothetical protein